MRRFHAPAVEGRGCEFEGASEAEALDLLPQAPLQCPVYSDRNRECVEAICHVRKVPAAKLLGNSYSADALPGPRLPTLDVRTLVTNLEGYLITIWMCHQSTGDESCWRHQGTNERHLGTNPVGITGAVVDRAGCQSSTNPGRSH